MDALTIAKKLIEIPSFVGKGSDEREIGSYVYDYLKNHCSFFGSIKKQPVAHGRFNVLARTNGKIRLLFACHLDTVHPSVGGRYPPLQAVVKGDRLYGLGAKDMKGGTAALLSALAIVKRPVGLEALFYVDEEYRLQGMKKFVRSLEFKPSLVVSPESDFEITNGRRGILTLLLRIKGKSAHSARPHLGRNAVAAVTSVNGFLEKKLKAYDHPTLGDSTVCLVYLRGGTKNKLNAVPEKAESIFSLRPTTGKVNLEVVLGWVKEYLKGIDCRLTGYKVYHDYKASFVGSERLRPLEEAIVASGNKPRYAKNLGWHGFNDVSLIYEKVGSDFVNFGPRGADNHQPDEWVSIKSLKETERVYVEIIKRFCS